MLGQIGCIRERRNDDRVFMFAACKDKEEVMRRAWLAVGALAILVGGVCSSVALASAPTRIADHQTLRFTARITQLAQIDLSPTGFSQGDELVIHRVLLQDGVKIGHDGGECTVTFVKEGAVPQFQCVHSLVFPDGQITGEGLFHIADITSFSGHFAIIGGTGSYRGATGEGTIHQTGSDGQIVFRLDS
jgi:hypothetical protein